LFQSAVIYNCCCLSLFARAQEALKRENERRLARPALPIRFSRVPVLTAAGGLISSLFVHAPHQDRVHLHLRTPVANGAMAKACSEPGDAGLTWRQKADAIPWVGWLAWLPGVGVFDLLFVPAQGFPIITTKFSEVGAILASPTLYECN
jgi:hypothetical protein